MRRIGLAIIIVATVLLLYHGYARNGVANRQWFATIQYGQAPNILQMRETTDLLLTDIRLQLFGLALISLDRHEVRVKSREQGGQWTLSTALPK